MRVTFFKKISGAIINSAAVNKGTALAEFKTAAGVGVVEGFGRKEINYVSADEILLRPANTTMVNRTTVVADGVDSVILSNIPGSAIIFVTGQGVVVNQPVGNTETITFDLAGEYQIKIEAFPFLDYEVTINAN